MIRATLHQFENISFSALCKELRQFFGYTSDEMAKVLDVHPVTYRTWEQGNKPSDPNGQAAYRIAQMEFEMRQLQKQAERKKVS